MTDRDKRPLPESKSDIQSHGDAAAERPLLSSTPTRNAPTSAKPAVQTTAQSENSSRPDPIALGYVERRARGMRDKPGMVDFDELGNAQYRWSDERFLEEGEIGESRRLRALSVANLVLVDDEPPPDQKTIAANKNGLRLGYNPYDSGRLEKQQRKKPRDLRALSKWIEAQRNATDRDKE